MQIDPTMHIRQSIFTSIDALFNKKNTPTLLADITFSSVII